MHPVTTKKRAAIHAYVSLQGAKHGKFIDYLVEWTIKAIQMPSPQLYGILERKGYRWTGKVWAEKPKEEIKKPYAKQ